MNVAAIPTRPPNWWTGETPDRDYYLENGYVVVRGLIPEARIAALLESYRRDIVPSRDPFFRQSTNAYERNRLSPAGYVRQSFLDIHDYAHYADFSERARDIFCAAELSGKLCSIAGTPSVALMQTMLFDLNAATPGHQDYYYLDSVPNGNLIAAWIALEDIDERAGRFYVLPGSQRLDFGAKLPGRTHAQWLASIRQHLDAHCAEIVAPALRAGDVLFWNSRTVHGSLPTRDEAFSRKSLTAHFLPQGYEYGNLFAVKLDVPYKEYMGVRYYRNQPDFSQWNRLKFAIKTRAYNFPALRETLRAARDAVVKAKRSEL